MSGSSNLNSFRDRGQVAVQLVSCGVLPPGLVQDCTQHSCVIAVNSFSSCFVSVHVVQPYSSIDVTASWKKLRFILSVRSDFHIIDSLLIAVHAFVNLVSMSFSVDSTLSSNILSNSLLYKGFFFVYTQLNVKTVLFQTIQFSIQKQFH